MAGIITVDYNPDKRKFIVGAPPWLVERCRGLPNRRWNKTNKTWVAPLITRNVEYLQANFADAIWTDSARRACDELVASRKMVRRLGFPTWYKFKREPRKKQREALDNAYGMMEFGFIMDPGTGKSQALVDWAACYAMEGRIEGIVVVVPNSVTYNWIDELRDTCPIEYVAEVLDTGSYKIAERMIAARGKFKWLIVSWESLSQGNAHKYVRRFLESCKCMIAGDESSWAKNHKSIRTKTVTDLGLLAQYRAILTGTPVLKELQDLYSQMEVLNTEIIGIGDFYAFRNRYCIFGGYENKEVEGYKNVDELMELIKPYVFVAYKRECIDIPAKTPENSPPGILRHVQLTEAQRELYKKVKSKYNVPQWDGRKIPVQNTLELALRFRQICQGIVSSETGEKDKHGKMILRQDYIISPERNPKILEMLRLIEESDEQMLIWSPFRLDVEAATEQLRKKYGHDNVLNLPSGDAKLLQQRTREFRASKYRFCVATQQQGGIGLNMQSASVEIFLANTENLENRIQAEGRIERDGQQNPMTIYDILATGTVDTKTILPSLIQKKDLADYVREQLHGGVRLADLV
jgi:hypothetical protein